MGDLYVRMGGADGLCGGGDCRVVECGVAHRHDVAPVLVHSRADLRLTHDNVEAVSDEGKHRLQGGRLGGGILCQDRQNECRQKNDGKRAKAHGEIRKGEFDKKDHDDRILTQSRS
ncbi:MAG: hypothetical protein SF172_08880 [Burkholderiales bacterium]|nr:hypothetical protein [Burkholderiales bacterium]